MHALIVLPAGILPALGERRAGLLEVLVFTNHAQHGSKSLSGIRLVINKHRWQGRTGLAQAKGPPLPLRPQKPP